MASIAAASAAGVRPGVLERASCSSAAVREASMPSGADLAGERHGLAAGLRRRRHAAQGDVHRDPIDAEIAGQQAHGVAHAKGGVARPQHRRAETQQDVEGRSRPERAMRVFDAP